MEEEETKQKRKGKEEKETEKEEDYLFLCGKPLSWLSNEYSYLFSKQTLCCLKEYTCVYQL